MSPRKPPRDNHNPLPVIGWREWVHLPELGGCTIKAKVDTGARTSALHAFHIEEFERDGVSMASFELQPLQKDASVRVQAEAPIVDRRWIKSSNGIRQKRLVITSPVRLADQIWPIEFTLTSRDAMGFRMLLGRQAIREHFLVDAGRSFLTGVPEEVRSRPGAKKKRKKKKAPRQDTPDP